MNEYIFKRILAGSIATNRTASNRTATNLEPKLFESSNLESLFSPTVSHEVHHQNFKHQQRHPSRNP